MTDEAKQRQASPMRMKKMFVLGALLVEQYHEQVKAKAHKQADGKKGGALEVRVCQPGYGGTDQARAALAGLLEEDSHSASVDTRILDGAWRGAEAYHFYMLAQRQLYEGDFEFSNRNSQRTGQIDPAMKTALHLTEFDDIIDPVEVYSLLGLFARVY